jgi:hypothetical protein
MIEGSFDARTLANMNVALARVCGKSPSGEQHDVRKRIAQAIVECAKSGKMTLGALTEAGEKVLWRIGNAVPQLAALSQKQKASAHND